MVLALLACEPLDDWGAIGGNHVAEELVVGSLVFVDEVAGKTGGGADIGA